MHYNIETTMVNGMWIAEVWDDMGRRVYQSPPYSTSDQAKEDAECWISTSP